MFPFGRHFDIAENKRNIIVNTLKTFDIDNLFLFQPLYIFYHNLDSIGLFIVYDSFQDKFHFQRIAWYRNSRIFLQVTQYFITQRMFYGLNAHSRTNHYRQRNLFIGY